MAKNTLEIIFTANSKQAVAAINQLRTAIGKPFAGISGNLKGVSGVFNEVKKEVFSLDGAFKNITGVSLQTGAAFIALGAAIKGIGDFLKSSVTETIAYAQSVRELSYVLGTNAEETSRLIQVADDYLISTEKLSTALRFAVKNGFAPTVESLAQLADRFNSISDPTQRAAEMVKIFGRNWSALVPLLQAGGDAIRANAAAVNDALVLNDAQVQATFEYQKSLDQLDDSIAAIKTSIGMALIPALNDFLGVVNNITPALNLMDDLFAGNITSIITFVAAITAAKDGLSGDFLGNFAKNATMLNNALEEFQKTQIVPKDMNELIRGMKQVEDTTEDAADSLKDYAKELDKLNLSTNQQNQLIEQFAANIGATDAGALTLANDIDLLNAAVEAGVISVGQWTDYMKQAADGTLELTPALRDLVDASLEAKDAQSQLRNEMEAGANAISSTRLQLLSLSEQLRTAGPRERRNIVLDQLKELLSTTVDPAKAQAIADGIKAIEESVGLITPKSEASATALNDLVKALFSGQVDPSSFDEALQKVQDAIRNWKPGEKIDVFGLLQNAGLMPNSSDLARITDEWSMIGDAITTGLEPLTAEEGVLPTANLSLQNMGTAIGTIGENSSTMATSVASGATSVQTLGTNASTAVTPMALLEDQIVSVGVSAQQKVGAIAELVKNIQELTPSAAAATGAVAGLARAINSLQSKTITITVNYVENFPGSGGLGDFGAPTSRTPPRRRASGGQVDPLHRYIVGERGPELLIPATAGTIIPSGITQAAIMAAAVGGADIGAFNRPQPTRQERRAEQALQTALNQTYKPFKAGGGLPGGVEQFNQYSGGQSATADTETERMGGQVTYNTYFPIQKVEDELDARAMARLVAAELARMPSR